MPENIEKNRKETLPGRVYHVSSAGDDTVSVAMDVTIDGDVIRWFDTIKERIMTTKEIKPDAAGALVFVRAEEEGGGTYEFFPMTLELYNGKVREKLLAPKDFGNLEDLLAAFEETKKNAW
jgi:hypothetical protein